jgi:5'-nucleotidase (lipoprotein e(P4) family)
MKRIILMMLAGIVLTSCQQTVAPKTETKTSVPSQEYIVNATLFSQQAAEYRALCYQAYNLAASKMMQALEANPSKPAVLLDLDETVLDNSPYFGWQVKNDEPFTPATWNQWVAKGEAHAIPGVSDFLHLADSLGVTLFYVSNRDTSGLMPTMKNMQELGMPQAEKEHYYLKSTTSDKTERRQAILDMGYNILFYVGDNMGDYQAMWDAPAPNDKRKAMVDDHRSEMGDQFIILPNALYGTWLAAVYNFDRNQSDSAFYQERIDAIASVEL